MFFTTNKTKGMAYVLLVIVIGSVLLGVGYGLALVV